MGNKKLTRRGFLGTAAGAGLGGLALPAFSGKAVAGAGRVPDASSTSGYGAYWKNWRNTSNQPPRKVIVGTVMQPFWVKYPGLEKRLAQLMEIVDRMQAQSQKRYGRGLDLAVLPEIAITGEGGHSGNIADWSYPLQGPVQNTFARKARQKRCYIVAPLYLLEHKDPKRASNAAVLFGRQGEVVGIYRKVHLVTNLHTGSMEDGCIPGNEETVFNCDFGKLGIQICFDMAFDYGFSELARKGAELVVWPSQSPWITLPSWRALYHNCYIVSSTWRNNASVFEPTGRIVSQVRWKRNMGTLQSASGRLLSDNILAQEIDLSFAILPWSRTLRNGEVFAKAFGDKVGFHYYDADERGIFWSNDPHMTIGQMVRSLHQTEEQEYMRLNVEFYRKAGILGY